MSVVQRKSEPCWWSVATSHTGAVAWGVVTFAQPSDAQKAVDHSRWKWMKADHSKPGLEHGVDETLREHQRRVAIAITEALLEPFIDVVVCADIGRVG